VAASLHGAGCLVVSAPLVEIGKGMTLTRSKPGEGDVADGGGDCRAKSNLRGSPKVMDSLAIEKNAHGQFALLLVEFEETAAPSRP